MNRAVLLAFAAVICVSPISLSGTLTASAKDGPAAYKAPRNAFGQPDLSGNWSNASRTPETRDPALGNRLVYTPAEVKAIESAADREVEEGNENVDPNLPAPKEGGEIKPGTNPIYAAAGGGVGGYDRGWLDPGSAVMKVNGEARTSLITTPNGQVPPRKAGAPAAPNPYAEFRQSFDSYETRSLGERCIMGFGRNAGPPMFANGFYNNNYQFLQTPDTVAIVVEMVHDTRVIRLNSTHRTDGVRPWMGDSIGHWEGDTLVVETTNIPRRQAYRGSWEHLTVIEKFTRVGKNRLYYQFTLDDPTLWEKPWGGEYEFTPLKGAIYEYACHEGNYALAGILGGARYEEAEAAKAAAEKAAAAAAASVTSPSSGKKGSK